MRKTILLFISLTFYLFGYAESTPGFTIVKITSPNCESNVFETDSIKIKFELDSIPTGLLSSSGIITFQLENKLSERVYIEWENARVNNNKVVFGEDTPLTAHNPKVDESIPSKSVSLKRIFFTDNPSKWSLSKYPFEAITINSYKYKITFRIPVKFENNKVVDYDFVVETIYYNTADYSQVEIGMKDSKVKDLMGKPNSKGKKENDIVHWYYYNNVEIVFQKKKVIEIIEKKH